jgi:Protein of unknown function (DUF1810)
MILTICNVSWTPKMRFFEHACAELREGQKQDHRMLFIFPQPRGLGNKEQHEPPGFFFCPARTLARNLGAKLQDDQF